MQYISAIKNLVRKPGAQTGSGQCDGDKEQMFQYLAAGAAIYGIGFAAAETAASRGLGNAGPGSDQAVL